MAMLELSKPQRLMLAQLARQQVIEISGTERLVAQALIRRGFAVWQGESGQLALTAEGAQRASLPDIAGEID